MSHKMLVPFDFSPASERALAWAGAELKQCGGAVVVMHIINPIPLAAITMPAMAPPPSTEDIDLLRRDVVDAVARLGVEATVEIVLAPAPGEAIVRTADANGCTLIAMGTHGRGGLTRAVLGSVADYVVRHAHCAVVTVRAPAAKTT